MSASQKNRNQMETKFSNTSIKQIRFIHLLVVAFLSSHLGIIVNAQSIELLDGGAGSPLLAEENYLNDVATSHFMDKLKRSWKSLQGSWGKRSGEEAVEDDYDNEPTDETNELQQIESEPMKYYVLYAPNLDTISTTGVGASSVKNLDGLAEMEEKPANFEKKNWKNMNVAWGKRRSAVWNKFRGAWGKREPAWNNLKGMWGKRSPKDWRKLQSSWGKRSQQQ